MSVSIVPFPFKGDSLALLSDPRGRFLTILALCRPFDFDPAAEWDSLTRDDAMVGFTRVEIDPDDGTPLRLLQADAVPLWLASHHTTSIPQHKRAKFSAYKREIVTAVYDYTATGVAIRPGTPTPDVLVEMAKFLERNGGERDKMLAADLIRSQVAALTGAAFAPGPQTETVRDRIVWLRYPYDVGDAIRIGAVAKSEYRKSHNGQEPPDQWQWVDGGKIKVAAYPPEWLPRLDNIIHDYMRLRGKRQRSQR